MDRDDFSSIRKIGGVIVAVGIVLLTLAAYFVYTKFRIDVPQGHIAVLTKKTGKDLNNDQVVAPDKTYKGLQQEVLAEGRYFYNPWHWSWSVYPMVEVPAGKLGVRVRLYGENLPYAHFLATKETQKGIVEDVLRPGRYAINAQIKGQEQLRSKQDFAEIVELYDPINVVAGYRGVVTNLAGPMPEDPNEIIVEKGYRGVQKETLDAGTYYLNPYCFRVNLIDCRSQRFNLAEDNDMGFPSKDGFWVSLDGIVEFRVKPEMAPEIYVIYNEIQNDSESDASIHQEVIDKVVMPNARSFCRLRGSNKKGRDFIGGETRTAFQKDFADAMHGACDKEGIEIVQALITKISPPQAIAGPVRDAEIARQKLNQYKEQVKQQQAEAKLAIENALVLQKKALVTADQKVIEQVTLAEQEQKVAVTKAEQEKAVAERDLAAAQDQAAAKLARKKAEASIIEFANEAEAAGWRKAIEALGGDGDSYARFVLYQRLAPAYRQIMTNTADSPLMDIFKNFKTEKSK